MSRVAPGYTVPLQTCIGLRTLFELIQPFRVNYCDGLLAAPYVILSAREPLL